MYAIALRTSDTPIVIAIDVTQVVIGMLVILACTLLVWRSRATQSSAVPMLVVYVQADDGPYKHGTTVRRVLRSGIPAQHPIVYVCMTGADTRIIGPGVTPSIKSAITTTLANVTPAVLHGSLDSVRDGLRYNGRAVTVNDCCTLLGVHTDNEFATVTNYKTSVLWLLNTTPPVNCVIVCAAIQCFGCHAHRNLLPTLQSGAALRD